MVLKDELKAMQERYDRDSSHRVNIYAPEWLNPIDPLRRVFRDKTILLEEGKVAFACIVEANVSLFKFFPREDYPAYIVYSTDPIVAEHPQILSNIASRIYSYKNEPLDTVPKEWQDLAKCISYDYSRGFFTIQKEHDGQIVALRFIPILVFRDLLPCGKLCGSLLPVLTTPKSKTVLILPKKYWGRRFRRAWSFGSV